ncbi:MAG: hypothetical protein L0154_23875 [Chloroflexi bacterium]|nr:hypothetical protein [Chloroflexota bacterium]
MDVFVIKRSWVYKNPANAKFNLDKVVAVAESLDLCQQITILPLKPSELCWRTDAIEKQHPDGDVYYEFYEVERFPLQKRGQTR